MAHQSLELINENAFSFDQKGFKIVDGTHHEPYANSAEILSLNLSGQRHVGQEFKVWNSGSSDVDIWHFIGGTAGGNLVKKAGGSGTGGGALLQTNSVDNDNQGLLNMIDSDTVTAEYISPGKVTFHSSGGGGGGTDTNFANNDLTADADRTHDFAGHKVDLNNLSEFNIKGYGTPTTVPYVQYSDAGGATPNFMPNFFGKANLFVDSSVIDNATINVILNIDGVDTAPLEFTKLTPGRYTRTPSTGTAITCVSYEYVATTPLSVEIDVPSVAYDATKQVAIFDGNILKKEVVTIPPDTNMAIGNLIATGNRDHDFAGYALQLHNLSSFLVSDDPSIDTIRILLNAKESGGASAQLHAHVTEDNLYFSLSMLPGSAYKYILLQALDITAQNSNQIHMEAGKTCIQNLDNTGVTTLKTLNLYFRKLPTYDTEAAAVTAGLVQDQVYKTTTGELRIKL